MTDQHINQDFLEKAIEALSQRQTVTVLGFDGEPHQEPSPYSPQLRKMIGKYVDALQDLRK